jgi:hypothetical protein
MREEGLGIGKSVAKLERRNKKVAHRADTTRL